MRSRPYQDSRNPEHSVWQQRVRSFYDARQREEEARQMQEASSVDEPDTPPEPKMEDDGNTIVSVRAYTRHGEKGPVHVSSHQRSSPD